MIVTGTISVTHVNAGAVVGAIAQGVCRQVAHAKAVFSDTNTTRATAGSHFDQLLMAIDLKGELTWLHSIFDWAMLPRGKADQAYTTKTQPFPFPKFMYSFVYY